MRKLILGTAGHIDHGKTELVRALTGVDTDRLPEEKERGITIDLGFAELAAGNDLQMGVVDVPGHEGFIRNMLAGATGMDLVLLVVAADEGIMPQTREHLAIVSLLGVERLVVALTKVDLVDEEWLALVTEEVERTLADTPYAGAPIVATSAKTRAGLDQLVEVLERVAGEIGVQESADVARLPIDRVFTVRGTGTVVTGTLWSGRLRTGEKARVLPRDLSGRVRGLQVHGREVELAQAGERTAVALTGSEVEREALSRGQVVVTDDAWIESNTLTVELRVLRDSAWAVEHSQRVRVHIGTAECMARVVLLERDALLPGDEGWAQLRLEAAVVARGRERFVIRSYSPVTTIGGGSVAESSARKRSNLVGSERDHLGQILRGTDEQAIAACVALSGWLGLSVSRLPVTTGLSPDRCRSACGGWVSVSAAAATSTSEPRLLADTLLDGEIVSEARQLIEDAIDRFHLEQPLLAGMDLEAVRHSLPRAARPGLADAMLDALVAAGRLDLNQKLVSRRGYAPTLSSEQSESLAALAKVYEAAGIAPPAVSELPGELASHPDLWHLLRMLEQGARITRLDTEIFIWSEALRAAREEIRRVLSGRTGLGPADFKDALPVTRKHLLPILAHFDQLGVTTRRGNLRDVPPL